MTNDETTKEKWQELLKAKDKIDNWLDNALYVVTLQHFTDVNEVYHTVEIYKKDDKFYRVENYDNSLANKYQIHLFPIKEPVEVVLTPVVKKITVMEYVDKV